jgi:hypothetical protein
VGTGRATTPTWPGTPVVQPLPGMGVVAGRVGPMTYSVAYSYLLALLTGQARLRETKAIVATAICESIPSTWTRRLTTFVALARP